MKWFQFGYRPGNTRNHRRNLSLPAHGSGSLSTTAMYFLFSGVLLIVGAIFVLLNGSGIIFVVGVYGLIGISIIDNALLYLTRTYGLGFLSSVTRGPPAGGDFAKSGNFTRIGNFTRSGNFTSHPAFTGGFSRGIPWSTSWLPPGAVQTFVLQVLIIVVAVAAIIAARRIRKGRAAQPSPLSPAPPESTKAQS